MLTSIFRHEYTSTHTGKHTHNSTHSHTQKRAHTFVCIRNGQLQKHIHPHTHTRRQIIVLLLTYILSPTHESTASKLTLLILQLTAMQNIDRNVGGKTTTTTDTITDCSTRQLRTWLPGTRQHKRFTVYLEINKKFEWFWQTQEHIITHTHEHTHT